MSAKHPIIAVTGSSGAGTTTVRKTFESIFRREKINGAIVEGDAFHRYTRTEMGQNIEAAEREGRKPPSHFGPEANLLAELETLFREYGEHGTGKIRQYIHGAAEARRWGLPEGYFTPWEAIGPGTDLLFYEGLHGAYQDKQIDVARHADLLIGVVPIINLEWIQKIHRDTRSRGYSLEAVTHTILRRMPDYVHHITPQFSRTHINFQRVPTVDTSNPFSAKVIPSLDESMLVIRFRGIKQVDFPYLLSMIDGSFMSRMNTIVVPGGKMGFAMELILRPLIQQLLETGKIT